MMKSLLMEVKYHSCTKLKSFAERSLSRKMHKPISISFHLDQGEVQPPQMEEMGKSQVTVGMQSYKEEGLQGEQKQKGMLIV